MNITNETLYKMILEIKTDQADLKTSQKALRKEFEEFKVSQMELKDSQMELKTAQAELRADITKWGVFLFVGSVVAMTSILSVVVASVLLVTSG